MDNIQKGLLSGGLALVAFNLGIMLGQALTRQDIYRNSPVPYNGGALLYVQGRITYDIPDYLKEKK